MPIRKRREATQCPDIRRRRHIMCGHWEGQCRVIDDPDIRRGLDGQICLAARRIHDMSDRTRSNLTDDAKHLLAEVEAWAANGGVAREDPRRKFSNYPGPRAGGYYFSYTLLTWVRGN